MDLHDRYMKISTTIDFSMFELFDTEFENNPFPLLHRLIKRYNDELIEDNCLPARRLNTLRTLLCYEYGLVFDAKSKNGTVPNDLCIKFVKNSPLARSDELRKRFTDHATLFDVLVLRLTLHCDAECGTRHLVDFCESNVVPDGDESRSHRLKILECFLEASRLKTILYDDPRFYLIWKSSFGPTYLREVTSWLKVNTHKELRPFASVLPKLLDAFGPEYVLPELCASILNGLDDIQDSLGVLSVLTDISVNTEGARFAFKRLYCTESLWSLIMKSLRSSVQQCRKQGMFVMKRMTSLNFVGETFSNSAVDREIVPFLCGESSPETKIPIDRVKEDFFLIMEALEEKQHHLVVPALKHLTILVEGSRDHCSSCNNCFSDAWVRLVFERILRHWNPAVVKQGILYSCELPVLLRDRRFLGLFVRTMNNTFLYECRVGRQESEIFDDVVKLFVTSQSQRAEFLSQVVRAIAEVTWAPVPLFYVTRALRTVSSKVGTASHWGDEELNVVARLTRTNLNVGTKHSHNFNVLNGASQIELLRTVAFSVDRVTDLKRAASTILEFPVTLSWNIAGTWLRKITTREGLVNFLRDVCSEYSRQDPPATLNPADFAVLIVMFCDTGPEKTDVSWAILGDWLSRSLKNVAARPYADAAPTLYAIEFLSEFVHLSNSGVARIPETVQKLSSLYVHDAMKFLYKNTRSIPRNASSYEQTYRYFVVITKLLNDRNSLLCSREILNYAQKFTNECIIVLGDERRYTSLHRLYALKILHYAQEILSETHVSFYEEPLSSICDVRSFDDVEAKLRGAVASDYYKTLARLADQYLSRVDAKSWPGQVDWFACVSHLHEMGGNEIVPEVAPILRTIVDKGLTRDHPENRLKLQSTLAGIWRSTMISTKNYFYFFGMKSLVRIIVNNNFLVEPSVMSFVDKLLDELIEEGDQAPRLRKYLLNEMNSLDVSHLNNLQEPLLACLLHGDVLRKDKQIESQAYSYIAKNYEDYCFQNLKIVDYNDDVNVRAMAVTLLHRTLVEDATYGSKFLPRLIKKLDEYKNKRYYHHSYVHKVKHRIMQVLLIIQPTLTKEDAFALEEYLCDAILVESNQHSVRLMQEWILVRIYLQYTDLHEGLWIFFEKAITTRPTSVPSVLCVAHHVLNSLPTCLASSFISKGIGYVSRCCLGQLYTMRLYGQIIFVNWYDKLGELNCDGVRSRFVGLYDAAIASLSDGSGRKHADNVTRDFYLSVFHATRDYTLETIYLDLPRLSNMIENEWVTPSLFKSLNFKETLVHPLRLYNLDRRLSDTETFVSCLTKPAVGGDTETCIKDRSEDVEGLGDVQRKVNPSNSSYDSVFPTVRDAISHKRTSSDEEGLIVVASLVGRAPNLGGLARTCEVFDVKELVIGNLSQTRDKEFQNLSVSAHNWITITETKPQELQKYLLNKKDMGWSLVGVEQTANSKNVLHTKFEKKTILVLGNEKDGISANLIPLFDVCVEIPQAGMIRSLNVHVSGAICIWEYAKQHVLTES